MIMLIIKLAIIFINEMSEYNILMQLFKKNLENMMSWVYYK